jgi:7-cyano-7-deazaguanine synthase
MGTFASGKCMKKTVVIHSGGMDSSICLALAVKEFGSASVMSLSFDYGQRHIEEIKRAAAISKKWKVDHMVVSIDCLSHLTINSLTRHDLAIEHYPGRAPNTLVVGRNGLMARLGALQAHSVGARCIYMGVIEVHAANSGYRDCSRHYMDLMQEVLRLDLKDPLFEIRTPLVGMTKVETLVLAHKIGVLPYLLKTTISCYEGIDGEGCCICPACLLRNEGVKQFKKSYSH